MGDSIGAALSSSVNASVQRMRDQVAAATRATPPGTTPFSTALDAATSTESVTALASATQSESVDEIWKRVELLQSAMHGQGDALMATLRQAADERWERRDRTERGGGFDLSDFA